MKTIRIYALTMLMTALLVFYSPVSVSCCAENEKAPSSAETASVSADEEPVPELQELDGKRFGVQTGSTFDRDVETWFPHAQIEYYNSLPDLVVALQTGKIDAFPSDEIALEMMKGEGAELNILEPYMDHYSCGFVFAKTPEGAQLRDEMDTWLTNAKKSGALDEMLDKWLHADEDGKTMPDPESLSGENGTLVFATEAGFPPFDYIRSGEVVGFEVEMAIDFCAEQGYGIEIIPMNFDGILPAIQSGKVDFSASGFAITPERMESINFSQPYYSGGTKIVVSSPSHDGDQTVFTSLEQLDGRRIGIQTGTTYDAIVQKTLPNAELVYFNTYSDLAAALSSDRIDGFPGDEPALLLMAAEDSRLAILEESMEDFDFGLVTAKTEEGELLCAEFNGWLKEFRESGGLEKLRDKWFNGPEEEKTVLDCAALPAPKGVLEMATEGAYAPMNYYQGEELVGLEVDLAAHFCEACGYGLNVTAMNFDGILPAVESSKADMALASIGITDEREESVCFSDPYYTSRTLMAVRAAPEESAGESWWSSIFSSFQKTFIREDRWKLFAEGIGNTLLITVLSILSGTALGFAIFMLCRNGNPAANAITRVAMRLVQGMPMVVLLMILYYIIFGSLSISGIAVAVAGFMLTFGAGVFSLLQMGVGAVDRGQYEAAYALGHSDRHTFFHIILPQALPHILPAYKGEIVSLLKATAIVGYIAVQDLTKMGDIVRSRTYEAFFPLIAVAVIYFVLEDLFSVLVTRLEHRLNPRNRTREAILKGVKTDDSN